MSGQAGSSLANSPPKVTGSAFRSYRYPGTKRVKWIEQNAAALDLELTCDDLAILEALAAQVSNLGNLEHSVWHRLRI